jgi:hypothetical protein
MIRLLMLAVTTGVVAGCGTIECNDTDFTCDGDNRPSTLEYVTETVLRPYCANGACHSAFTFAGTGDTHYRFDTVDHTRQSILHPNPDDPTNEFAAPIVFPGDAENSLLFLVLTRDTGPSGEAPRMPYDQPLPTSEIALIKRWINEGADGLGEP